MADFEKDKQETKTNSQANETQGQQGEKNDGQSATAKTGSDGQNEIKSVNDIYNQAKDTAGKAYSVAADKATSKIDEQKTNLAQGISGIADTIRQLGDNLQDAKQPNGIADIAVSYSNTAADKVEQISEYLEKKDLGEVLNDVEDFAHRSPLLFLGGAFALGILAARFLKSSSSNRSLTSRPRYARKTISLPKKSEEISSAAPETSKSDEANLGGETSGIGNTQSASAAK